MNIVQISERLQYTLSKSEVKLTGVSGKSSLGPNIRSFLVIGGEARLHLKRLRRCFAGRCDREVVRAGSTDSEGVLEECRNFLPCVLIFDSESISKVEPLLFARLVEYGRLIPVLALMNGDESPVRCESLLRMGCMGFLEADTPPWQIRRAVDAVAAGELWAPRALVSQMCRDYLSADDPRKLTGREEEILALLGQGRTNREIADALFITRETVRWHMRAIYAKLGVHDRSAAASYATGLESRRMGSIVANDRASLAI